MWSQNLYFWYGIAYGCEMLKYHLNIQTPSLYQSRQHGPSFGLIAHNQETMCSTEIHSFES